MLSDEWLSRYGLLENFNASVTRTGTGTHTGTGMWTTGVTAIALCTSCSRAKKGSKTDVNNFRPISVLPTLNSVFERHVSSCMTKFLDEYNLIYELQSGFRRLHSCQTALTKVVDNWLSAINNSNVVGTVFLDLSKAFDLVNHNILIQKLKCYKFSSSTIAWFESYLN